MKVKPCIISLLLSFFLFGCNQTAKNKFTWLEGKWAQTNGEANFHEEWQRVNENILAGKGFVLSEGDTLFSEKLTLESNAEKTVYRVEMTTGRIAEFKLTEESDSKLVFEMPENDFPSKIIYNKKSDTELTVVLEGKENGKEIKDELEFKRAQ
ncbi:MAG: hypothetical protein POELPBGB_02746 [Bacteroidia bacterium]|nr:hypothetical protein [Bacteroidia bacterium]